MSPEGLESAARRLDPSARARLAGKLLESLDSLSEEEAEQVWTQEAARRSADLDEHPDRSRSARDVFRDARAKLK